MNYKSIFGRRSGAYDRAMRLWPEARQEELTLPVQWAAPKVGDVVVDVPAGGGYLREYLPESCSWFGHEPCEGFHGHAGESTQELLPLPWPDTFADIAISLAGVHHLTDKRPLFEELHRVLKPGGRFVLADAREGSNVARFLDEFVGIHNSTGHDGIYLNDKTMLELEWSGLKVLRSERTHFRWWFEDPSEMVSFCRQLFDLQEIEDVAIAGALDKYLGLTDRGRKIGMNWELMFVLAART